MSAGSSIEWTDATWNPMRGCVEVSPGCARCYAQTFAERFRGVAGHPYEQGFDPRLVPEKLDEPLRWREPRRVFVNSMSDLFGEWVSFEYVAAVFGVMAAAPAHTFQVLTKRAERMGEWFAWAARAARAYQPMGTAYRCASIATNDFHSAALLRRPGGWPAAPHLVPWPLRNVWLGVSVENRKHGLPRIDQLREVPAAVRFLSIEPLLEDLGPIDLTGIHWVIVGGESGPKARPFHVAWARNVIKQCRAAGVPVFCKQLGANVRTRNDDNFTIDEEPPDPDFPYWPGDLVSADRLVDNPNGYREEHQGAPVRVLLRNRKGGDPSEWPADLRAREFPEVAHG